MKDLGKKKLLVISLGIIALVFLIVIILLIYHAINGDKKLTYKEIENEVVTAAKKYYNDNQELLPKNENEQVSTTDTKLTDAGYLKSMIKLTKGLNATCSCEVLVNNSNGNYRYTALLDCGDKYKASTLTSYIKNNVNKVYSGDGLYELNNELVYRGEYPNNYVRFANKMFRIVKVENDSVVLIANDKIDSYEWDNRYNIERGYNDGINDYEISRIKEKLAELYNNNTYFVDDTKSLLKKHSLFIGKRSINDSVNNGSIEKSKLLDNEYIGLLPLYDYINASIDENCNTAEDYSCSNYNYLNYYRYNWWTITADANTSHKVFRISSSGAISLTSASSSGYLRPVIYLASDVLYVSGTGSEKDPFIVK